MKSKRRRELPQVPSSGEVPAPKKKVEDDRRAVERFESEGGNPGPPGAARLAGPREDTGSAVRPSDPAPQPGKPPSETGADKRRRSA